MTPDQRRELLIAMGAECPGCGLVDGMVVRRSWYRTKQAPSDAETGEYEDFPQGKTAYERWRECKDCDVQETETCYGYDTEVVYPKTYAR